MTKTIKCDNCGANMKTDTDNAMRFCPFCGNAIKMSEDYIDLAKYTMKHNENVRRQIVKENQEKEKRNNKQTIIEIICIILIIIACGFLIAHVDPNRKCEQLVEKVQSLIIEENYDEAMLEAQKIRVEKRGLFDSQYDRWENQRKDLIKLIEHKRKESGK